MATNLMIFRLNPQSQSLSRGYGNLTLARSPIPVPASAPAATLHPEVTHAPVVAPLADANSGTPATLLDLDGNKGPPHSPEPPKLSSNRIDPSRGDLSSTSPDCTVDPITLVGTTQPKASVAPPPVSPNLNSPHHFLLVLRPLLSQHRNG
jgi:hypothetical protein